MKTHGEMAKVLFEALRRMSELGRAIGRSRLLISKKNDPEAPAG